MIDKTLLQTWIAALRSKKYKQTTGYLQADGGYCCLGVLCDIVDPAQWDDLEHMENWDGRQYRTYAGANGILPYDLSYKLGAPGNTDGFLSIRDRAGCLVTLIDLNDEGFTFEQIADLVEAGLLLDYMPDPDEIDGDVEPYYE